MTLSAEDHRQIEQLLYRYGYANDFAEWDTLTMLFTPDAVVDMSSLGLGTQVGTDEIMSHLRKPRRYQTAHLYTNVLIEEAGDDSATVTARAVNPDPEGRVAVSTTRMTVRRTESGWRISRRESLGRLPGGPGYSVGGTSSNEREQQ